MVSLSSTEQSVLSAWSSNQSESYRLQQSSSFFFSVSPVIDLAAFCSVRSVNKPSPQEAVAHSYGSKMQISFTT